MVPVAECWGAGSAAVLRGGGPPGTSKQAGRRGPRGTRPGSRAPLDRPRWPGSLGHLSSRAGRAPGVPDQGSERPWTARAGRVARGISSSRGRKGQGVPDQGPEHPWTARAGRVARDV